MKYEAGIGGLALAGRQSLTQLLFPHTPTRDGGEKIGRIGARKLVKTE